MQSVGSKNQERSTPMLIIQSIPLAADYDGRALIRIPEFSSAPKLQIPRPFSVSLDLPGG